MSHNLSKVNRPISQIRVRDLDVRWIEAQRKPNQGKITRIQNNFDPDAFGVIAVARVNGKDKKKNGAAFHIIDGQHRVAAVRNMWGPNEYVPCQIIENADSPSEAASIWLTMNTERSKPHIFERFKVAVTAGRELEVAVNNIIELSPYTLAYENLACVGTCCLVYRNYGGPGLVWVLDTLHEMWGDGSAAVQAGLVGGLSLFWSQYVSELDRDRLIKMVSSKYTPSRLIGMARTSRDINGGTVAVNIARVLRTVYNRHLRDGSKLELPPVKSSS